MKKFLNVFLILFVALMMSSCTLTDNDTNDEPASEDTILFGSYPQNEVFDELIISELSKLNPNEKGYLVYDNIEYCEVDGHYYTVSPISWKKITVNGKKMYITEKIIDCMYFLNIKYFDVCNLPYSKKPGVPQGTFANNYTYSDLRDYLNDVFYNKAFSDAEKSKLDKISYDGNSDYIYTLSISDLNETIYLPASATSYAVTLGVEQIYDNKVQNIFNGNSSWWLRDSNDTHLWRAAGINFEGTVLEYIDCHFEHNGIRPVIYINE